MFFFILGPKWHLDTDGFREHCREVISEITQRDGVVMIEDGEAPVARMTRYVEIRDPAYGAFKDVKILGNIEGPMPVEWYTDPKIQADEDWTIDGPMPASWFADPYEGQPPEYQHPEKVDVSILRRHKLLTVDTGEFIAQLEDILVAVSETKDGKVIIFDDENPLVEVTRCKERVI